MIGARPVGPLHHRKPWRTDPGRQDHTLLPSADVPPETFGRSRVLAPDAERKRCDSAVSIARMVMAHGVRPPCHPVTRRRCRVHRIPAYVSW